MAIRATVSVATLSASISITTENSLSASVPVLQASIYAELLEAGVHYINNNATGIWTDADSKNRFFYDELAISDVHFTAFTKNVLDNVDISDDDVLRVGLNKVDTAATGDSEYKEVVKALVSVGITSEEQQVDFLKTLVDDSPFTSDTHKQAFSKLSVDSYTVVDSEYRAFYKALTEAPSLVDAIDTVAFFKNTQDSAGFSDIETFAFAKFLFDNVTSTDDIDGAASILDDQEMQYHKNTTNISAVTDVFFRTVQYVRAFNSPAGVADNVRWGVSKELQDNSTFTELHHRDFGKLLVENPTLGDALAIQMTLAPFSDTSGISDNAITGAGKNFTNTASLADTGSLRSQGYSDFTFFAEDYVGSSRNF